jgi:hypothetical protein
MRIRRSAVVTGLALLMGCGTDPNMFHVGCGHVSTVQAGPGLTPAIDWSPSCRVASLKVYEAHVPAPEELTFPGTNLSPGPLKWSIINPDSTGNILEPTVRYGQVPKGMVAQFPAEPLSGGLDYLIEVGTQRVDGGVPIRGYGAFRP